MKKTTTFQTLFDGLPEDILAAYPLEEDTADLATVNRVWKNTARLSKIKMPAKRLRCAKWLIPVTASLLIVTMVIGAALPHHMFTPTYRFEPPVITREPIVPLVERYEHANDVQVVAENDGAKVTLDKYTVDTVAGVLRFLIRFETTDGSVLTELSAERVSQIIRTSFKNTELTVEGDDGVFAHTKGLLSTGENWQVLRRSDAGEDPHCAVFEYRCHYNQGDGDDLLGKTYTLRLTDFYDEVEVTKDLGFAYESMQALFDDMTPAENSDYVQGSQRVAWEDGAYDYYYALKDSGQRTRFSVVFKDAYIDNIGFRNDLSRDFDSELYVSFSGLSQQDRLPVLVDIRNGAVHYSVSDPKNDSDRVTVSYPDVMPDMLPYLFMMQEQDSEFVTRAEGTWTLTFTAERGMKVREFEVDTALQYHEYDYHVTRLEMTDSSLFFEGEYTIAPTVDGQTTWGSIYGTIDLVMADGSVMENPFYQGPGADIRDGKTSGIARWGGVFTQYIDVSQVVAVIALGETIPLA